MITRSRIVAEGTHSEKAKLESIYTTAVANTQNFYSGLLTSKETKLGNGVKTEFFRKDNKEAILEWYLIHDRQGWELGTVTYKATK